MKKIRMVDTNWEYDEKMEFYYPLELGAHTRTPVEHASEEIKKYVMLLEAAWDGEKKITVLLGVGERNSESLYVVHYLLDKCLNL